MKKITLLLFVFMIVFVLSGCNNSKKVRITLVDGREINLELYSEYAPKTVKNFLNLVDKKYYDGVIFHRVIQDFMIQTGGYYLEGNSVKEKEKVKAIKGEFADNGFAKNTLKHELGVISMARTSEYDTASNQFFLVAETSAFLDDKYAAFGKTIDEESNKVILEISKVRTANVGYGFADFPVDPIIIKSIRRI